MGFAKLLALYAAAFCTLLVGWVLNVTQLYWMGCVLVLAPIVSRAVGRYESRGLILSREIARSGHQGDRIPVRFRAQNLLFLPKLSLTLSDQLPRGLRRVELDGTPLALVPRGFGEASYELHLALRGLHSIPAVELRTTDALGLAESVTELALPTEVLVYPRIVDLPPHIVPDSGGGGRAPILAARKQGEGGSFLGVREYRPGDPLRHVHWRTAARLGQLAVVEFETEESLDALIAIETQEGSEVDLGNGTTLDLAAGVAASLAAHILSSGDSVRLLAPGMGSMPSGGSTGSESLANILDTLARMKAVSGAPLSDTLLQTAGSLPGGMLVCWLTPRVDASTVAALRVLRGLGLRPVLYALGLRGGASTAVAAELNGYLNEVSGAHIPVIRIPADDPIVARLLS